MNSAGRNQIGPIVISLPTNSSLICSTKTNTSNDLDLKKLNAIRIIPYEKYGIIMNCISFLNEERLNSRLHKMPDKKKKNIMWKE